MNSTNTWEKKVGVVRKILYYIGFSEGRALAFVLGLVKWHEAAKHNGTAECPRAEGRTILFLRGASQGQPH
jgi:hypothetical protein